MLLRLPYPVGNALPNFFRALVGWEPGARSQPHARMPWRLKVQAEFLNFVIRNIDFGIGWCAMKVSTEKIINTPVTFPSRGCASGQNLTKFCAPNTYLKGHSEGVALKPPPSAIQSFSVRRKVLKPSPQTLHETQRWEPTIWKQTSDLPARPPVPNHQPGSHAKPVE